MIRGGFRRPASGRTARVLGGALAILLAGLSACSASPDARNGESEGVVHEAIVNGSLADAGSPVLYLVEPQGNCSAVLVAPNLAVTARHCASPLTEGGFVCAPNGDLEANGTGAGTLGADDPASALHFYTQANVAGGTQGPVGPPDAIGAQVLSTDSPTICHDDVAFVVLDRDISGITPAPIRIDRPTAVGEPVSVLGYGDTGVNGAPVALRINNSAQIDGIGPTMPPMYTQPAPLRAVSVGPGTVACSGDSGGAIISRATGALIAVSSLAPQTVTAAGSCNAGAASDLTGPDLYDYQALAMSAFSAAGASPVLEPLLDAGVDSGPGGTDAAATPMADATSSPPNGPQATGGSCSIIGRWGAASDGPGWTCWITVLGLVAVRRRTRFSS